MAAAVGVLAALAADLRHVLPIFAHDFAALATRLAGLFWREFVRGTLVLRGLATLAGDLALLLFIHRGEAPFALVRHCTTSPCRIGRAPPLQRRRNELLWTGPESGYPLDRELKPAKHGD